MPSDAFLAQQFKPGQSGNFKRPAKKEATERSHTMIYCAALCRNENASCLA